MYLELYRLKVQLQRLESFVQLGLHMKYFFNSVLGYGFNFCLPKCVIQILKGFFFMQQSKKRVKPTNTCLIAIWANFLTTSCWCKRFLLLVLRFIIQNSSLSPVIIFAVWLNLLSYRRSTTVVIRQIICNIWSWDNSMMIQWNIWSCCSFLI